MNRLFSTLRLDILLQWRNGFYYASLFVAVTMILVMRNLFSREILERVIPYFLYIAMSIAFYFMAGLVLLEKGEGTLDGIAVSPLRTSEYLFSKVIALTLLMVLENLAVILFTYGFHLSWMPLLTGAVLLSAQYAFLGLIIVARYDSITDFIIPAVLYMSLIQFPFFMFIESIPWWIFLPWPSYGPLLLFQQAFTAPVLTTFVYAVLYSIVSILVFYTIARRSFERFIVRKEIYQS